MNEDYEDEEFNEDDESDIPPMGMLFPIVQHLMPPGIMDPSVSFDVINDQWNLKTYQPIDTGDDDRAVYLEFTPTENAQKSAMYSVLDFYDAITKNKFVEFISAYLFHGGVNRYCDMKYCISYEKDIPKINVMIQHLSQNPPQWIADLMKFPQCFDGITETYYDTEEIPAPMMVNVDIKTHLYEPLMVHEMTFFIGGSSDAVFAYDKINVSAIYMKYVRKYIEQAINRFYPKGTVLGQYANESNGQLINTFFDTQIRPKGLFIRMYSSPGAIVLGNTVQHMLYCGRNRYKIYTDSFSFLDTPTRDPYASSLIAAIECFSATKMSQPIIVQISKKGFDASDIGGMIYEAIGATFMDINFNSTVMPMPYNAKEMVLVTEGIGIAKDVYVLAGKDQLSVYPRKGEDYNVIGFVGFKLDDVVGRKVTEVISKFITGYEDCRRLSANAYLMRHQENIKHDNSLFVAYECYRTDKYVRFCLMEKVNSIKSKFFTKH